MTARLTQGIALPVTACLLLLAQNAIADSISFSSGAFDNSFSIDVGDGGDFSFGPPTEVTGLPKFDPALGTLTEVSFEIISGTFEWDVVLDGFPFDGEFFIVEFESSIQADLGYFGSVQAGIADSIFVGCEGEPGDECFDGNGNFLEFEFDGFSFPRLPGEFDLADIMGTGDIPNLFLQVNLDGASFITVEGMEFVGAFGQADITGATVEVTYTFTANASDADEDGVNDDTDNCTVVSNPGQVDTDADGHGNACDADFDNNCVITFPDLAVMQAGFFTINPLLDLDSSGGPVNFADLAIMQSLFFVSPGPSAPGALCSP